MNKPLKDINYNRLMSFCYKTMERNNILKYKIIKRRRLLIKLYKTNECGIINLKQKGGEQSD